MVVENECAVKVATAWRGGQGEGRGGERGQKE